MFALQWSRCPLVAFLLIGVSACAPRPAQNTRLLSEWNTKCKEAADLLETVKDVATARSAAPRIAAVMRELRKIDEQLEKSYDPTDVDFDDAPRLTRHAGEGIVQMQRLMKENLRIGQDPELKAALGETWNLLPVADMMEAGVEFPPIE
jgi:hypothetical protein